MTPAHDQAHEEVSEKVKKVGCLFFASALACHIRGITFIECSRNRVAWRPLLGEATSTSNANHGSGDFIQPVSRVFQRDFIPDSSIPKINVIFTVSNTTAEKLTFPTVRHA
jgi:hypothetical protein